MLMSALKHTYRPSLLIDWLTRNQASKNLGYQWGCEATRAMHGDRTQFLCILSPSCVTQGPEPLLLSIGPDGVPQPPSLATDNQENKTTGGFSGLESTVGVRTPTESPSLFVALHNYLRGVDRNVSVACTSYSRGKPQLQSAIRSVPEPTAPSKRTSSRNRDVPQALPLPLPLPAGCRSCFRPLGGLGGYTVVSYQGMIIPTAIPTMIPKRSSDFLRVFFF
jgi:hypothetical protein